MSRPTTEQIGATVPVELADAIRDKAKRSERSFSAEVRFALRRHVADISRPGPATAHADHQIPEAA